jgi:hypothetical protein
MPEYVTPPAVRAALANVVALRPRNTNPALSSAQASVGRHTATATGQRPCQQSALRLVPDPATRTADLIAMLDVAGDEAVASHSSAAHVWGYGDLMPFELEVATPRLDRHRFRKVHAHRSLDLVAGDCTMHHGIRVTSVARMVMDLSARCSVYQLADVVIDAEQRGYGTRRELAAIVNRLKPAPGRKPRIVRDVLTFLEMNDAPVASGLAHHLIDALTSADLPLPERDVDVCAGSQCHRVALAYPHRRVMITCAPWSTPVPARAADVDATMSSVIQLRAAGWHDLAITWAMSSTAMVEAVQRALLERAS